MIWKILAEMSHALCLWSILSKGANFGIYCLLLLDNNIIKRCLRVQNLFWGVRWIQFHWITVWYQDGERQRFTVAPNHTVQSFRQLQANSRQPNTHVMSSTCRSPFSWCNTAYVNCEPPMGHKHQTKAQGCIPPAEQHQQCDARLK